LDLLELEGRAAPQARRLGLRDAFTVYLGFRVNGLFGVQGEQFIWGSGFISGASI
jgi:hypothetical protein